MYVHACFCWDYGLQIYHELFPVIAVKILESELRKFTVEIIDARDGCHVVVKWESVRKYDWIG